MPSTYRDAPTFFAALFAMAEDLREKLIPMTDAERARLVTEIFHDSDLVFGVWPEEGESFGVQIIMGQEMLPPVEGFERNDELRIAAIPCVGLEQALAARDEWGDLFEACVE